MEGVYAALAIVGAVTGYGFSKAKKQSTKKYTLSADDIRVTTATGAVVDGLFQTSPHKQQAYDCLLSKLPGFLKTKAAKTMELYTQSKDSGAPPSVAYTNIRLGLLQDRELGNITASQELYFPKREQFYQWFKECIAAGPQPVTPASARMPSQFTDRSASQFTDRSRSVSAEPGWGGEESPVPLRLMNLETKRTILQRMGITDRATFGQWAETHRRTNPQRVAEIEAIVNEVFPAPAPAPQPSAPAPAPLRIAVPESPAPTGETPLPAPTPTPAPEPTPAPQPSQGAPPRITLPPQLPPAPAPAETVPLPSAPSAEAVAQAQRQQATPSRLSRLGQAFRAPFTRRNARVIPADAPQTPEAAREFLRNQTPPITDMNSFAEWARQNEGRNPMPVYQAFLRGYPDIPIVFPDQPQPVDDIVVNVPAPAPRERQSMASRWRTQRARRNLFGRQPPAPAPAEFEQVNPMLAPAPQPTIPPPTREQPSEEARAALFGRQPPAPAVTQRQRPSFFSRLRNVTLRAPRGATPKQNAAKATLDQLGITDVATFSTYIQGKSSTEQMDALQNGVIAYPDDADLLLDAMTADETAGTAFAQSSDALKKPIQKAADKARKKRPAALVTAPSAISAMTAAPPSVEEPPVELDQINPMFAPAPGPLPPHLRGPTFPVLENALAPQPLTVPAPPPSQPRTPEEMEAQLNSIVGVPPAPTPAPPSKEELLTYLREQNPPIVDMNSFLAWTKANENTLSRDEILRVYKMAIEAFPASAAPLTSAPRVQAVPLPIPAATPQQIEELRGFLAMQTPPITDLASLQQWMRANESKSVNEKENIFLLYERTFQTSVNRDFILGPAAPPVPEPGAGTGLGLVAPPPLPVSQLTRQQGTRQFTQRAKVKADARKMGKAMQTRQDFQRWLLTTDASEATKPLLVKYIEDHPERAGEIFADLNNSTNGRKFLELFPDVTGTLVAANQLRQLETQGSVPEQLTPEDQALLAQIPSEPQDELDAILNAPTPTPTPASQASAATASSGEVWTPETAEPSASIPAPPPGPPPESAPVPPRNLNSGQAKEWLRTNLGVENQQDFRRWIRENTSKVTEPILTTAEIAYPMGTLAGTTNFRTVYEALKSGKTVRATTQRQGGRKARKNTLRSRRKVDTKNVRRSSYRKNRANRRN